MPVSKTKTALLLEPRYIKYILLSIYLLMIEERKKEKIKGRKTFLLYFFQDPVPGKFCGSTLGWELLGLTWPMWEIIPRPIENDQT